jgi:NYN domain
MKREAGESCLSAVFVDYDNIYLSLKRKSDEAARRFAKDAAAWLRGIETGRLITATNAPFADVKRRLVMNRCYGNPVPRRNTHDNSTDMNSFPFVRHHFLRAGFEVVDCPPLTAQLKNSSDIRMVMDVRDYLTHDTYFDEFIILSGDADFTPVLHRLRAHARRTVIFANDFTAAPYTAISDGEVRETDLIALIMGNEAHEAGRGVGAGDRIEEARRAIMAEVVAGVRASPTPIPLEALADRALRALGHEKTVATSWAGAGSFRELLRLNLPEGLSLSEEPPYTAFDVKRHGTALEVSDPLPAPAIPSRIPAPGGEPAAAPLLEPPTKAATTQQVPAATAPPVGGAAPRSPAQATAAPAPGAGAIQQSIARIQEACQAPPLAPHEYRLLFEVMANEISAQDLISGQTLTNIVQRAQEKGLELRRDDVRFVLEVVSEADPWFEQGASANLFAGRFRNFVVARCRGQGLNLSADELDLIDAWFAGGSLPQPPPARAKAAQAAALPAQSPPPRQPQSPSPPPAPASSGGRWWSFDDGRKRGKEGPGMATPGGEELPRIVTRGRMRG